MFEIRPLVTAALLALGAEGHAVTEEFGRFTLQIAPNSFEERCIRLAAGQSVRYRFKSSAAVDFNLHYHRGSEVFYPVRKSAVTQRVGRYRAKRNDVYCLMWENRAKAVASVESSIEGIKDVP